MRRLATNCAWHNGVVNARVPHYDREKKLSIASRIHRTCLPKVREAILRLCFYENFDFNIQEILFMS